MRKAARAIIFRNDALLVMKRNKFGYKKYVLIGGGVSHGESVEQALVREVREETGLEISKYKLVGVEHAGDMYGIQYVFLCEDPGGEVALHPDTEEAKIHALGQNLYEPMWLPIKDLADSTFVSEKLKQFIIDGVNHGFPEEPQEI